MIHPCDRQTDGQTDGRPTDMLYAVARWKWHEMQDDTKVNPNISD